MVLSIVQACVLVLGSAVVTWSLLIQWRRSEQRYAAGTKRHQSKLADIEAEQADFRAQQANIKAQRHKLKGAQRARRAERESLHKELLGDNYPWPAFYDRMLQALAARNTTSTPEGLDNPLPPPDQWPGSMTSYLARLRQQRSGPYQHENSVRGSVARAKLREGVEGEATVRVYPKDEEEKEAP